MRLLQSGTSQDHNKHVYKSDGEARSRTQQPYSGSNSLPHSAVLVAIGIMVSAWLIIKALVAFAPLTGVYAQYGESSKLPLLLDATGEELTAGLEAGNFTSLDLVQVSHTALHAIQMNI